MHKPLFTKHHYIAIYLLLSFHLVGAIGLCMDAYRDLFLKLTPLNLIVSALLVFGFHAPRTSRFWLFFVSVATVGYLIELVGITTGFPFGAYHYGSGLGPKLLGVPPVIGLNWALLVYCTGTVAARLVNPVWLRVVLGAALMVIIDLPIEPVAPFLDFWHWDIGHAPLLNFIGWWLFSIPLQALYSALIKKSENSMAPVYLVIVWMFFMGVNIFCLVN